jgi:hypothetical protein
MTSSHPRKYIDGIVISAARTSMTSSHPPSHIDGIVAFVAHRWHRYSR